MAEAVGEDGQASLGVREDRLRVELDRRERQLLVLDRHDLQSGVKKTIYGIMKRHETAAQDENR